MSTIWKNWCRLCARHDGGSEYDEFFKLDTIMELSELVQKYFLITVSETNGFGGVRRGVGGTSVAYAFACP